MTEQTYAQRDAETKAKAASILKESAPRTDAEQAAIDALDQRRWVLWHADDYSLGVIRLLSCAGLLRDKKHEAEQHKFGAGMAEASARERLIGVQHNTALEDLIDQAAKQLENGDAPGDVAAWMRERRTAVTEAVDKAKRAHLH